MSATEQKTCERCGARLGGMEERGSVCNECLSAPLRYMGRRLRACAELGDDPERAVQDLVDFVRKVPVFVHPSSPIAQQARELLERHRLLRPCDDVEQLPDAWKPNVGAYESRFAARFRSDCPDCGARDGEPCYPHCEDGR